MLIFIKQMTSSSDPSEENHTDMTTNQMTAIRIKDERLKKNYAQQALADHLGMNISNYSRLENGKIEITIEKLEAIAEFLKVPFVTLLPNNLPSNVNIDNGSYGKNTMINNYADEETQKSLKMVIKLLEEKLTKNNS